MLPEAIPLYKGALQMLIDIIGGARPNFMKIAPIVAAIREAQTRGSRLAFRLIHTGQHYDTRMSDDFFLQLGIPRPDFNLKVGSGTHAEQTGAIMLRYEQLLLRESSRLCLVVGDVTSTMACAITAQKLNIPVAHVEAGIRSQDWSMPEEINRLVTDSITNWFFTTSEFANENLRREGVTDDRILFVGNTMIDTLLANLPRLREPSLFADMHLRPREYVLATLHRPANVDNPADFSRLLQAIGEAARDMAVIFPAHPRTTKTLERIDRIPGNLRIVDPQPYLEFIFLVKNSLAVVTDSGGITEETTVLGVPCLTLRDNTERPETVTLGTNELIGTDPSRIKPAMDRVFDGRWKQGQVPPFWDGNTGRRIVSHLERLASSSEYPT